MISLAWQGALDSQVCSWDITDSLSNSTFGHNVWFNASGLHSKYTPTFPGGCEITNTSCGTAFGECSCRSWEQWQAAVPSASSSLLLNPKLQGPLRLVTAPEALAMGIAPLTNLANVGPDWPLPNAQSIRSISSQ